jgi:hypothetical protein
LFSVAFLSHSGFAQKVETEVEVFNKISKLTQTKKADDQEKAYKLSKDFLKRFGNNDSEPVKKVRDFVEKYEIVRLGKFVDDGKFTEAFAFGKELLAEKPENSEVTMLLAFAGYQAVIKKQDKSFGKDSIEYAKTTLRLFGESKLPKDFAPFTDQPDATAMMYYVIGSFLIEENIAESANNFYKSVLYESKVKTTAYPYYILAFYYEKKFENMSADFQTKHGKKVSEDDEMRADNAKMEKLLNAMMDAYARAVKFGEVEKHSSLGVWKARLNQVYTFIMQSDAGLSEFISKSDSKPLPDPNTF